MPLLDRGAHEGAAVGAANCIRRREDGTLEGCNTDIVGLRVSLDRLLGEAQPSGALILGTGGASQAVQYALAERDIPFELVSRDPAKGNYTYDNLPFETERDALVTDQCSPWGARPAADGAPRLPNWALTPDHFRLDVVTSPPLTRFLDFGRQRSDRILNGETMFREQAEASWRFWNGSM